MEDFIKWTAITMERPKSYGAFHLVFWLVGTFVFALLAFALRKKSEKTIKWVLFGVGLFLLIMEIYKQLFYFYIQGNGSYVWWIFPFQLCSVPMYLCIIQAFIKNTKVKSAIYNFMMVFSFFSGMVSFVEPSGLTHGYLMLTLHAFVWHLLLVFIGFLLYFSKQCGNSLKEYFRGSIVFGIVVIIAEIINVISKGKGGLNMFYISPYVNNPIAVFKDWYPKMGWLACSLLYLFCIMLGAFIVFSIFVLIRKLKNKSKTKNV
ncbi:MAG: hypothetical protein E7378_04115 [Clostridiales bacterium]|nr:hypothetical protein [Clostridiales bacterium]